MAPPIKLNQLFNAIDLKDRKFYDNLTDEQKKAFSPFLALRWAAAVRGSPDVQTYFCLAANHYANKHLFTLKDHPKLQWLMLSCISPGFTVEHKWMGYKKKTASAQSKVLSQLADIYPDMKMEDLEVMSNYVTARELKQYAKDSGKS